MRVLVVVICLLILGAACRERYGLPLEASREGVLVVEGNILDGDTTEIRLSRTSSINDRRLIPEMGATLQIEGDDNSIYAFSESDSGVYKTDFLSLNKTSKYRLKISSGPNQYESEWLTVISTPDIDSVTWRRDDRDNGVEILVAAAGNDNDARYFKWDYDEVWEIHANFKSFMFLTYKIDENGVKQYQCVDTTVEGKPLHTCVLPIGAPYPSLHNDSLYTCWIYRSSSNINIGSTAALAGNAVLANVRKIEKDASELNTMYSILVKQTGLSKEGYEFYQILKANSEGLGTIFDAQPSQMKTNIKNVSNAAETVIGFVDATSVKTKRKFIGFLEVPDWRYYDNDDACYDTLENSEITYDRVLELEMIPTTVLDFERLPPYEIIFYRYAPNYCVDCRFKGGIHVKPEFWP